MSDRVIKTLPNPPSPSPDMVAASQAQTPMDTQRGAGGQTDCPSECTHQAPRASNVITEIKVLTCLSDAIENGKAERRFQLQDYRYIDRDALFRLFYLLSFSAAPTVAVCSVFTLECTHPVLALKIGNIVTQTNTNSPRQSTTCLRNTERKDVI